MLTHYEILSVKEDATCEEIRTSYRSAILNSHPDKTLYLSTSDIKPSDQFLNIQKAWEVLGDSRSRKVYDSEIRDARRDSLVAESLNLDDMMIEKEGEVVILFHQCRCSDYLSIDSSDLEKMGYSLLLSDDGYKISMQTPGAFATSIVLPCGSCSLRMCLYEEGGHPKLNSRSCSKNASVLVQGFINMGIFNHEEPPSRPKRCIVIASALKGHFSGCYYFAGRLSSSDSEEEYDDVDFEDDHEVVEAVIRSRFMEVKLSRKTATLPNSVSWAFFPAQDELGVAPQTIQTREDTNEEEADDFYSAGSSFSRSSSAVRRNDIFSMNANVSSSSSLNGLDLSQPFNWRRSAMQELGHCEGWPFGLCRKAVLLPPLPKCPSESWSWTKGSTKLRKLI